MEELIIIKLGEIILKGNNRSQFEDKLMNNIRLNVGKVGSYKIWKSQGTMYVQPRNAESQIAPAIEKIRRVFGITKISPAYIAEKDINKIYEKISERLSDSLSATKTFKVEAKRADKKFIMQSPEICREAGGYILSKFPHLKVDVINPEITVSIDVRDEYAFIYCEKIDGAGGIPTGMGGKGTLLLSGGIDSPVAGWLMAKRGIQLNAVNFFSYPYTSQRAKEKVLALTEILESYAGHIPLYIAPFTEIQMEIKERCPEEQLTIIMRRFMNRIAQKIAQNSGSSALITGESLGQVASQTMQSMVVTNSVAQIPVLRPLVGLDKQEIITYARRIGTFETSILPYEDCCTIFVPKRPELKPKLDRIEQSENKLDVQKLVEEAVQGTEIINE